MSMGWAGPSNLTTWPEKKKAQAENFSPIQIPLWKVKIFWVSQGWDIGLEMNRSPTWVKSASKTTQSHVRPGPWTLRLGQAQAWAFKFRLESGLHPIPPIDVPTLHPIKKIPITFYKLRIQISKSVQHSLSSSLARGIVNTSKLR